MTDAIIRYGTPDWDLIHRVFLDGELQPRVETINFTQNYIKRPYTGECNENQIKVGPQGYVFDLVEQDFILETVHGNISVVWYDREVGKAWLRRNSDA